jgi:sialate O-acetylesterase
VRKATSIVRLGLARSAIAALACLGGGQAALADVKLPAVFGSHMVLQRDLADKVWGWAEPGEEVTVTIAGQTKTAKADGDGKWSLNLDPLKAGGPHTLAVKGKNTVTFDDVLVGEVWICSGQSNMQWEVGRSNDADLEALTAKYPKIRFISVPQVGTQEVKKDFKGEWTACTPETVKSFSAVGYFFGRQLAQTLDVPIGLIDDAWGGSACEAWVRRDLLESDPKYAEMMAKWKKLEADYPANKAKYDESVAAAKADPTLKPTANPDGMMNGNSRPGNIYNGVLKPTIGYGIRGAIWYQGESNAGRAYQYRDLFPLMIQSWRDEWKIGDFPFYWVQLADFMAEKPEPGDSAWAELREAQTLTLKLPKTGEAVIIDLGEAKDIHPTNKLDVAKRLARWALAKDYGISIPCQSPTYQSMEKQGNKVILTFDHADPGLKAFDVADPVGFSIAGTDRKFVEAKAKIVGKNKVEVWSDEVSEPASVRYAWADNPVCNLYGIDGLPVTPFRTDDWPGVTANNH